MWHVSSRSGVATLRTAVHLLLTYLLTYTRELAATRTTTPAATDNEVSITLTNSASAAGSVKTEPAQRN